MRLCAAVLLAAGLFAPLAHAAAVDVEAEALATIDRGIDAYRAGDFPTARRTFEAAQKLAPGKANPYRWLGLTAVALGDCSRAVIDFDSFLQMVPASDERVAEVHRLRNQCLTKVDLTRPAAPTPPPPPPRPVHRRWWFWTALGAGAAVIATGVTLGVVLTRPSDARLPAIVCTPMSGCAAGAM